MTLGSKSAASIATVLLNKSTTLLLDALELSLLLVRATYNHCHRNKPDDAILVIVDNNNLRECSLLSVPHAEDRRRPVAESSDGDILGQPRPAVGVGEQLRGVQLGQARA